MGNMCKGTCTQLDLQTQAETLIAFIVRDIAKEYARPLKERLKKSNAVIGCCDRLLCDRLAVIGCCVSYMKSTSVIVGHHKAIIVISSYILLDHSYPNKIQVEFW